MSTELIGLNRFGYWKFVKIHVWLLQKYYLVYRAIVHGLHSFVINFPLAYFGCGDLTFGERPFIWRLFCNSAWKLKFQNVYCEFSITRTNQPMPETIYIFLLENSSKTYLLAFDSRNIDRVASIRKIKGPNLKFGIKGKVFYLGFDVVIIYHLNQLESWRKKSSRLGRWQT